MFNDPAGPGGKRIELTLTRSERVSLEEALQMAALIRDESDAEEAGIALRTGGVTGTRAVSDGEGVHDGDDDNPTYQFTDVNNPDRNYSMSINSDAPDGREAVWNISERISREQALQAIDWIVDATRKQQALAAAGGADMFQMSRGGTDDTAIYQWTNRLEDGVNYSLQVEAEWEQAVFNRSERVLVGEFASHLEALEASYSARRSEIEADILADPRNAQLQLALTALETEYKTQTALIAAALDDGSIFYRSQAGTDDPSFQWTSDSDPNKNYTLGVNTHVPVGEELEDGSYASFRVELDFSENQRISRNDLAAALTDASGKNLIADLRQKEQADEALADPGAAFFRNTANGKPPTYQWSSSYDARVSYSVSVDEKVPVGEGETAGYATVAKFTLVERVSRAHMLKLLDQIPSAFDEIEKESDERRNARAAIADGESFTMSRSGGDDITCSWASVSDPTVSYTITEDVHSLLGKANASFKKSTRISREEVATLPEGLAAVEEAPAGLTDSRFGAAPIRELLLGGLASDPNWDRAVVRLVEGAAEDGTLKWTGYVIVSEDGKSMRSAILSLELDPVTGDYRDLDPSTPDLIDRVQYIETISVGADDAVTPKGKTAAEVFGDRVAAGDWPVSRVRISTGSFAAAAWTPESDFYDLAGYDSEQLRIAFFEGAGDPEQPQFMTRVEKAEVLDVVPLMRDEGMRRAALAALNDPNAVFYRIEGSGKDKSYQWTSSFDSNVSYTITVDIKVAVGDAENFTQEATFTTQTRVSRAVIATAYLDQLARVLVPLVDGASGVTIMGLLNAASLADFKALVAGSSLPDELKDAIAGPLDTATRVRSGGLSEKDWQAVVSVMRDPLVITNALISAVYPLDEAAALTGALRNAPDLAAFKARVASAGLSADIKAYVATLNAADWPVVNAEIDRPKGAASITPREIEFFRLALAESTELVTSFTKTETIDTRGGNQVSYNWSSADGIKNYSLACSSVAITEMDGTITYEAETAFSFPALREIDADYIKQLVPGGESFTSLPGDRGDADSQYARFLAALEILQDPDNMILITMTMNKEGFSYSWELPDRSRTFTLNQERARVLVSQDPDVYGDNWTFTFSVAERVSQTAVSGKEDYLTPEKKTQYLKALADMDHGTDLMMTQTGKDVSYSWASPDRARTYTLTKTFAKVSGAAEAVGKWDFNIQTRVRRSEVELYAENLPAGPSREQYLRAIRDTASWTVHRPRAGRTMASGRAATVPSRTA